MKMKTTLTLALCFALAACGGGGGGGGCTLDAECEANEFCSFIDLSCGAPGASGECTELPPVCTEENVPVCSCDGISFINACFAAMSGQSVAAVGDCQ